MCSRNGLRVYAGFDLAVCFLAVRRVCPPVGVWVLLAET
jgi:hypothetical protein